MTNSLAEPLINGNGREVSESDDKNVIEKESPSSGWLGAELKKQFWLAAPMVFVSLLQYSLNLASVMFVGHLGELALASASMATSIASVTGFSLMVMILHSSYSLLFSAVSFGLNLLCVAIG